MSERIIVRTVANVSYAGEVNEEPLFEEEGILLKPHPDYNLKIHIPKDEITDIFYHGNKMSYLEFHGIIAV